MTDKRALSGLRVLESGNFISAAFATKLMADLGAEIIKIEDVQGDESRRYGPFPGDVPHPEQSGLYAYLNAGKRSITLNFSAATGQRIFKSLVGTADVLIENHQPGALKSFGLEYAVLREVNPRLVMTSITTFGQTGPYKDYKGYDLTAWHGSGGGHRRLGYPEREPIRPAWYHANHWGAVHAAAATMMALYARASVGRGQHIDISEAEALATLYVGYNLVSIYFDRGEAGVRTGWKWESAPIAILPCKDGYVHIMTPDTHMWEGLVHAMGDPDWAKDPLFQGTSADRGKYSDELYSLMEEWLMSHTKEEVFQLCQANRAPCTPVYTVAEVLNHPHLRQRDCFVKLEIPGAGTYEVPGAPYRLSESPWQAASRAPLLGEHNEEVLCGRLGFSRQELVELRRAGVI